MNYPTYTTAMERFKRLEKIAFLVERETAHFDNPMILPDIMEARKENDLTDEEIEDHYLIF